MKLKKGFTLIELLIVITIIGILVSILVPSVMAAIEMAYRMQCAANLKGIGTALAVHATAFKGAYPDGFETYDDAIGSTVWDDIGATRETRILGGDDLPAVANPDSNTASLWVLIAKEYGKDIGLYVCPSAPSASADVFAKGREEEMRDFIDAQAISYSYQNQFGSYKTKRGSDPGLVVAADANPYREDYYGAAIRATDIYLLTLPTYDSNEFPDWNRDLVNVPYKANSPNHDFAGQNVLFGDGHVEWKDHPYCGLRGDNIWLLQNSSVPADPTDLTDVEAFVDSATGYINTMEVINPKDTCLVP